MESFNNLEIPIAEICRNHGIAVSLFYKCKEQFIENGKKRLKGNNKSVNDNNSDLKEIIGEFAIANNALKKTLKMNAVNIIIKNNISIKRACNLIDNSVNNRSIYINTKNIHNLFLILLISHSIQKIESI